MQALGYFLAFKNISSPAPLVIVLTEVVARVLVFPFINEEREQLVTGIKLPDLPLWRDENLNEDSLKTLGAHRLFSRTVYPHKDGAHLKKRNLSDNIITEETFTTLMISQLRQENADLRHLRQENADLRHLNADLLKRIEELDVSLHNTVGFS